MKSDLRRRLAKLETGCDRLLQLKQYRRAAKENACWLEELENQHGMNKMPGESRADALARWLGMITRELKVIVENRCGDIEDPDTRTVRAR